MNDGAWFLATVLVGLAAFVLRGYLGSYYSEKGKNLATKEDVADITSRVEGVKASIQVLTGLWSSYEEQRREWSLSFYDSSVAMLYDKVGINLGEFPSGDGQRLYDFQQSFKALVVSMLKQYQRIVVYFEHEHPVRVSAEAVLNLALELNKAFGKRFPQVKFALVAEADAHMSGDRDEYAKAVEKSNAASTAYWADVRPIADRYQNALREFLTQLNLFLRSSSQE